MNELLSRRVVQVVTRSRHENDDSIIALCEDGTMWTLLGMRWKELPSIPDSNNSELLNESKIN